MVVENKLPKIRKIIKCLSCDFAITLSANKPAEYHVKSILEHMEQIGHTILFIDVDTITKNTFM